MSVNSNRFSAVTVSAPAKLTLTLRVLGTRPDGFHELEALTVMISAPADTLFGHHGAMRRLASLVLTASFVVGCAPEGGDPAALPPQTPTADAAATAVVAAGVSPTKLLVVVEENHTQQSALMGMPYLAGLASTYGRTTAYRAVAHPSLPNYLALIGGSTFGVADDQGPASHQLAGASAFDRATTVGRTAKTYAEAMPANCALASTSRYAVKHNPWAYFADAGPRANCRSNDVPSGTPVAGPLRDDVLAGRLPIVGLLVPDICNDGHDCGLATADGWLKRWLPLMMQGPDYRAGRLAIVVTFDEDDRSGNNTVLTVVVAPHSSHISSATALTHYSLTRYFAEITGTLPLLQAATAPSLRAAFHLR